MNIGVDMLEKIIAFLMERVSPVLIVLFGSAVEGNFRADSDIDIAFFTDCEVQGDEVFFLAQELADLLSRDVDLIDLKPASTVFKAQIIGKGEIIYAKNDLLRDEYRIRVLKEYALLNEERAVILDRIKREGKIYE